MMRENYKEIYKDVEPDHELLSSVVLSANQKSKIKVSRILAVATCFIAFFSFITVGVYVNYKNEISVINEIISVPLAYETKNQSQSEKHIVRELQSGGKKIYIDADVIIEGDIKKMCIYNAQYTKYTPEIFEEILYKDNRLYFGINEETESDLLLSFEKFIYPKDAGFYLQSKNKLYNEAINFKKHKNSGCKITINEAKEIVELFKKTANLDDFYLVKSEIVEPEPIGSGEKTNGYYSFQYYQYADGFPLETVSADVYNGIASNLNLRVDDDGIVRVLLFGLDLNVKEKLNGKIMSVEDTIEKIKKSLPDLWLSEYAPVIEIRLEYMLDELDDKNYVVFPCWHFCIDETQLKNMSIEIQRENDTNDICINAVTGEMFRVSNRYPVYVLSDGRVMSTWQD